MNELINVCVDQARVLLKEYGEFYPFAFVLNKDGKIRPISAYFGDEEPSSSDVIAYLEEAFKVADNNEFAEVAICVDVLTTPANQTESQDTLEIRLDSKSRGSINYYVPYTKRDNDEVEFGEMFKANGVLNYFTS